MSRDDAFWSRDVIFFFKFNIQIDNVHGVAVLVMVSLQKEPLIRKSLT